MERDWNWLLCVIIDSFSEIHSREDTLQNELLYPGVASEIEEEVTRLTE